MVVLYMVRDDKCNSPAGRGDAGARFYNRVFRAICKLKARRLQGTLPAHTFRRLMLTRRPAHHLFLQALRPPF
jgi:hypothetical protein